MVNGMMVSESIDPIILMYELTEFGKLISQTISGNADWSLIIAV
jgi:hypothetical protein